LWRDREVWEYTKILSHVKSIDRVSTTISHRKFIEKFCLTNAQIARFEHATTAHHHQHGVFEETPIDVHTWHFAIVVREDNRTIDDQNSGDANQV
jgi:hypothetical protein